MSSCPNCGLELESQVSFCPSCGTKVVARAASGDSLIGRTLNRKYRLLERVGAGSMGTVYRAEHIALRKKVALKVLRPDLQVTEETLQRFQREGIAAGKFTHPNAIQIFDFDREDQLLYLAMEFVEGRNITELLSDEGRLPVEAAVEVVRQILAALTEAHDHGIIHRDLKPENIMVIRGADGAYSVKVLDFGLSKLIGLPLAASLATQQGRVMGTPLYMAPEQAGGEEVDHRSDLYATGLILYELLSGRPPFQADTFTELVFMQASVPAPSLCGERPELSIPSGLDNVIQKSLAKRRSDRFQSARELLWALDHLDEVAPHVEPEGSSRRPAVGAAKRAGAQARGARRLPLVLGGLAMVVVVWIGASSAWDALSASAGASSLPRLSMRDADARSELEARYVSLLEGARASLALGAVNEAMSSVQEALRMQCHDSEAFYIRALVYRARQDDDTALVDLAEALDMDPGYAAAAATVGWIHVDRGQLADARERFEAAERMDASSTLGLIGQGAVNYLREETTLARDQLARALERNAEDALGQYYLGRTLLDDGEVEKARGAFILAKRSDPNMALAVVGLGEAYLVEDRLGDAEVQFREALQLDPDRIEPVMHLASLLLDAERIADTLTVLEAPLQRHPEWRRLHVLRGLAHFEEGKDDAAIRALTIGVEDPQADPRARVLLGVLYQRQGLLPEALEQYRAASAMDDQLALPHLDEGLVLFAQDRFDEALAPLERAVAIDPENTFAHYVLAVLYMDYFPDDERALLHLEAYQEFGGTDERVQTWIRRLSR